MFTLRSNSVSLAGIVDRERERERTYLLQSSSERDTERRREKEERERERNRVKWIFFPFFLFLSLSLCTVLASLISLRQIWAVLNFKNWILNSAFPLWKRAKKSSNGLVWTWVWRSSALDSREVCSSAQLVRWFLLTFSIGWLSSWRVEVSLGGDDLEDSAASVGLRILIHWYGSW